MRQKQTGFTLVEIAIVLVIVGLLLGGVLKGQAMIENAKIKNLRNDFEGITAAVYGYQDRYKSMPGDDPRGNNTNRGWTDAVEGNGNGVLNTNNAFDAGANESQFLWQHLRYAGLISGNPAGATNNAGGRANPVNAYKGKMGISGTTAAWGLGLRGTILCAGSIPGNAAEALDAALDDGLPNSGQMRAVAGAGDVEPTGTVPATAYLDDGVTFYTICKSL